MTKDTAKNQGPKKFLYTGPTRSSGSFDGEDAAPTFNYNYSSPSPRNTGLRNFDIDGIWGLKDLSVPKPFEKTKLTRGGEVESWDLNVGKNYYSRHGGIEPNKGQLNSVKPQQMTFGVKTGTQSSFSNNKHVPSNNTTTTTWHHNGAGKGTNQQPASHNRRTDNTFDF